MGIPTERSRVARAGGAVGGGGGAKLDEGGGLAGCCGGADMLDSQSIPAFIGNTSGMGVYAIWRLARHRR